tara:strand:+ start:1105 stop:2340 length:1236 start_codon:yes stop_codon:yes gene_type:complete
MKKIGEFIYPWGNGHYSRMMRLNDALDEKMAGQLETHFFSKDEIIEKLIKKFPEKKENIHQVLMPTPIDGKFGPSVKLSMFNLFMPISDNQPLVTQISNYLREERKFFDNLKFDLVINDGDMGSNVLANNRNIPSVFVTNQFKPKLWKSRFYFKPALSFIAKQISKATKIIIADSPPPYTMCEYNLNFTDNVKEKITYVGHFSKNKEIARTKPTELELLIQDSDFGYWMRTGNKSTNEGTGERFEEAFHHEDMKNEKRLVSHAIDNPEIDRVVGKDGRNYSISEALEKQIDWIQIDKGFLSEQEKESVLDSCKYAVINGSHTVMGEILGIHAKPIIGIPIYDEHTNQIQWVQEKKLGLAAQNRDQIVSAINRLRSDYDDYQDSVNEFSKNFDGNGAENTAKIISEILQDKK